MRDKAVHTSLLVTSNIMATMSNIELGKKLEGIG